MKIQRVLAIVLVSAMLAGQGAYAQDAGEISDTRDTYVEDGIDGREQVQAEFPEEGTEKKDDSSGDSPEVGEEPSESAVGDEIQNETDVFDENDTKETEAGIDPQDTFPNISEEAAKVWMEGSTGTASVPQVYAANVILNGFNGDTSTGWYATFKSLRDPEYYELTEFLLEDGVLCWSSNFWNAAFNSDFRDNPSYFYEVVLMGFLKHEQKQMSLDGAWNSKEMSLALSIYNELVAQYTDTYEEGALEELVKSIGKMPAEEAAQKISALTNVSLGAEALNTLKQGCSTAKDLIDAISEYQTLLDAKQERITLLKLAKEKITDNDYFSKAVDDIIAKMETTPIEYLAGESLEKLWDGFMDSAWNLIVKGSPIEPVLKAIDIEKMTLDVLFNSSDTASNNFKLLVVYIVDTYFESALELSKANYESSGTITNAASFVECYQAYIDYQIYGLEYTKTFIKDIVDSGPLHNLIEQIFFRESIESAEELAGVCDGQISSRKSCLSLLGRLPGIYSNANGMTQLEDVLSKVDASGKVAVESISFSKEEVVLEHMDDIFVAYADVYPANASNKKILYTSSNPAVLEVPENGGFATLKSPGTVTVTAVSEDGGHTASQVVTVKEGNRLTEVEKGKCGENLNWVLYSDGTLYIYGKGYMNNLRHEYEQPWEDYLRKIAYVIISEGVTSIGDYAFSRCSSLKSITIPEGVTSIGSDAFYGCSSLNSITIPKGVASIEKFTFYGCTSLKGITIPEGVTSIELNAFDGCSSMESITIPEGVTSIGSGAFYGCTSLKGITIPEGVMSIEVSTFYKCSSMESITLPEGVTNIYSWAFFSCSSLKKIIMHGAAPSINDNAFGMIDDNMVIYVPKNAKGYDVEPWINYKIVYGDSSEDYKKGDVNEDGEVNVKDLQIILRGVCEKIELTERQKLIADVVEDGKVDLQDLRKELRFVCGKIEEL